MSKPRVRNRRTESTVGAKYIGQGTCWGNPFKIGEHGNRQQVIERFRTEVLPTLDLEPLIGYDLACWCAPLPCHGDVILEEIKRRYPDQTTTEFSKLDHIAVKAYRALFFYSEGDMTREDFIYKALGIISELAQYGQYIRSQQNDYMLDGLGRVESPKGMRHA